MLDVDSQKPPKGKWSTPPFDPRFPNQNQTRNCYQNFLGETLRARLGAGGKRGEAARDAPHLKMGRGSGTRLGGGDRWDGRGGDHRPQGRGLVWTGENRVLEGRGVAWRGWTDHGGTGPGREWVGPGVERRGRSPGGAGLDLERVGQPWWAGVWSWRGAAWRGGDQVQEQGKGGLSGVFPGRGGTWSDEVAARHGGRDGKRERERYTERGRETERDTKMQRYNASARPGEPGRGRRATLPARRAPPCRLPPLCQENEPPREEHATLRVLLPRVPLAVPHELGEQAGGAPAAGRGCRVPWS